MIAIVAFAAIGYLIGGFTGAAIGALIAAVLVGAQGTR